MPRFKGTNLIELIKSWNKFFKEHPEYKIIHSHVRSYASIFLAIAKKNGLYTISIYKDYQHTMLIDSKTNITKEKLPTTEISIDEYLSNASTITYKFNSANQTYYFESSTISNS